MDVQTFIDKLNKSLQGLPAPLVIAKLFNVIHELASNVKPEILDKIAMNMLGGSAPSEDNVEDEFMEMLDEETSYEEELGLLDDIEDDPVPF